MIKKLPDIESEGERIARQTPRSGNGTYLWTDLVGAVQTAIFGERARHPDFLLAMDEFQRTLRKGFLHPYDSEISDYLKDVVGVVEATSFEKSELWLDFAEDASEYSRVDRRSAKRLKWESTNHGRGFEIGKLASFPIFVSCIIDKIDGHRILFLEVTSTVVHHDLIRTWLLNVLPASAIREDGYANFVNASNFHNVFPRS